MFFIFFLCVSHSASETRFRVIYTILYAFYDITEYIRKKNKQKKTIVSNKLYFLSFGRNLSVFKNQDFTPKFSDV